MITRLLILCGIILLIDLYAFQAFKTVFHGSGKVFKIYWAFTAFFILSILLAYFTGFSTWPKFLRIYLFSICFVVYVAKLLVIPFLLIDDIIRSFRWAFSYLPSQSSLKQGHNPGRLNFINKMALIVAFIPFAALLKGMVTGAFDYTVRKVKVPIKGLPLAFKGFRIVQISDIHIGSFLDDSHLKKAFSIVAEQNPDIIFFTGDLVNNEAKETHGFLDTLKKLRAPMGVYSILGNHDYGDYVQWDSPELKKQNLKDLKAIHKEVGYRLLLDEHLLLERGGESINLVGIENWGAYGHFPKYGNLSKAIEGMDKQKPTILLSHDPSHWTEEVSKKYPEIDLTLSGHTHGMQFGIEIPGFKWSPIKYFYPNWADLYTKNDQHLYVNRGLGFLGYPGRVGIMPEITVIELEIA